MLALDGAFLEMKKSHIFPSLGQPGGNKDVLGISCNRDAPLLCQVGGWGGRASTQFYWKPVEQNSRTLQQPRHFQLDVQHSPTLILYRHSSQLHMSYSCAGIPRTHQGFARSWGAGQGMPYLRSREIVTLALNSKQTNKENFEVLQQPHSSY